MCRVYIGTQRSDQRSTSRQALRDQIRQPEPTTVFRPLLLLRSHPRIGPSPHDQTRRPWWRRLLGRAVCWGAQHGLSLFSVACEERFDYEFEGTALSCRDAVIARALQLRKESNNESMSPLESTSPLPPAPPWSR